jgi:Cu/Ag efflux protein CusF
MKKLYGGFAFAAALMAATTLPAFAADPPEGTGALPIPQPGGREMQQAARPADLPQEAHQVAASQRVIATVKEVDQSKGLVTLTSADGPMRLHFPPASIKEMKRGDKITAQFAFAKADKAEGSMRAYDAPKGFGEHRMTGTVGKIDPDKGWLQLKTAQGAYELRFPRYAVHDLKTGDRITIDLAFFKGA